MGWGGVWLELEFVCVWLTRDAGGRRNVEMNERMNEWRVSHWAGVGWGGRRLV